MMSIGLGGSYSNRTLPGFCKNRWPLVRRPSGPICTKLPVRTWTLLRYLLMRVTSARCLSSNCDTSVEGCLPVTRELRKSKGLDDVVGAAGAAGAADGLEGGVERSFGAGVGSGMTSALTAAVSISKDSSAIAAAWRKPAMFSLRLLLHRALVVDPEQIW